ncbi:TPA: hypothetical protein ACS74J_003843 [Providencia alcalifaciens]
MANHRQAVFNFLYEIDNSCSFLSANNASRVPIAIGLNCPLGKRVGQYRNRFFQGHMLFWGIGGITFIFTGTTTTCAFLAGKGVFWVMVIAVLFWVIYWVYVAY